MLISVPQWVTKSREELDNFVDDLIRKYGVDWTACHDSKSIEEAKETIVDVLWRIHESTNVEERKRLASYKKIADKTGKKGK